MTHNSYEVKFGHPSDFLVAYRFFAPEVGGRIRLPGQGYRSDFWYPHDDHRIFMIWPEFEDTNGDLISTTERPIAREGQARMWIINPVTRPFHKEHIVSGLHAYFMEGTRRVAECTVVKILGLYSNPIR